MAKKKTQKDKRTKSISMPVVNPHSAGIDVGGKSHFVCVAQDNVKEFGAFTEDLHAIAKHLEQNNIKTVAMESTGPYWKQLFVLLQDYGFEVILINARHLKNVKGHKTDVVDSKWIQLLHSIGILSNSFQPDSFTEQVRTYSRQRQYLIRNAARYISKMKKCLILMNIRLDNVLTHIDGKSGTAVIKAILSGERNVDEMAKLFDIRVKASEADIKKSLTGNWKPEYVFELGQSFELYNTYWQKIRDCDDQIGLLLKEYVSSEVSKNGTPQLKYEKKNDRHKNDTTVNVHAYAFQISGGVDVGEIPGVGHGFILNLIAETGLNLRKDFKSSKHFASWLGVAPNNKISGGKILSSSTPKIKSNLRKAFLDAANSAGKSKTQLGDFFRRIAFRKGRSTAIVATARKIAVSVYIMLTKKVAYEYGQSKEAEKKRRKNRLKNLKKMILNIELNEEEKNKLFREVA